MKRRSYNRREFKDDMAKLNGLFRQYCDPLPGTPDDEYDCITNQILSHLQARKDQSEIVQLIHQEFSDHLGVSVPSDEIETVVKEILKWWNNKSAA